MEENRSQPLQGNHHHQVLLDDLTSVIDVVLVVAFGTAIHLLRRGSITVATLAHALSIAALVLTAGHYVEVHMMGLKAVEQLVRRNYRSNRRLLAEWSKAMILSTAAVAALVVRFWNCRGVGIDCLVGEHAANHYPCKRMRFRFYAPVFSATVVFVFLCLGARLNAVLGGSVLHPQGGGHARAVLSSPTLVSAICISGCISVWLYSILVEAERINVSKDSSLTHHNYQSEPNSIPSSNGQYVPFRRHEMKPEGHISSSARLERMQQQYAGGGFLGTGSNHGLGRISSAAPHFSENSSLPDTDLQRVMGGAARFSTARGEEGGPVAGADRRYVYSNGVVVGLETVPLPYPGDLQIAATASPRLRGKLGQDVQRIGPSYEGGSGGEWSRLVRDGRQHGRNGALPPFGLPAKVGPRSVCSDGHRSIRKRRNNTGDDMLSLSWKGMQYASRQPLRQNFSRSASTTSGVDGIYNDRNHANDTRIATVMTTTKAAAADGWTSSSSSSSLSSVDSRSGFASTGKASAYPLRRALVAGTQYGEVSQRGGDQEHGISQYQSVSRHDRDGPRSSSKHPNQHQHQPSLSHAMPRTHDLLTLVRSAAGSATRSSDDDDSTCSSEESGQGAEDQRPNPGWGWMGGVQGWGQESRTMGERRQQWNNDGGEKTSTGAFHLGSIVRGGLHRRRV